MKRLAGSGPDRLESIINLNLARDRARRALPRVLFDFVDGGAEDEVTMAANLEAFRSLRLRPRAGIAVAPDLATTVMGQRIALPVMLAPCGLTRMIHPDAEIGVAAAAVATETVFALTTFSGTPMEDVAARSTPGRRWFQLYFAGGREGAAGLIARAQRTGYTALIVTVDCAVVGRRERDARHRVTVPFTVNTRTMLRFAPQAVLRPRWLAGFIRDGLPVEATNVASYLAARRAGSSGVPQAGSVQAVTWDDVAWARGEWSGPLIVKGIMSDDDARAAVDAGADGVIVSNHGGRQLDGVDATLERLPEVVAAVGHEAEVFLDGGVRRGTDVIKAIALGARAVFIGRPYLYGLAAGGQAGVEHILGLIKAELITAMTLLGCGSVGALDASWLASSVDWPADAFVGTTRRRDS